MGHCDNSTGPTQPSADDGGKIRRRKVTMTKERRFDKSAKAPRDDYQWCDLHGWVTHSPAQCYGKEGRQRKVNKDDSTDSSEPMYVTVKNSDGSYSFQEVKKVLRQHTCVAVSRQLLLIAGSGTDNRVYIDSATTLSMTNSCDSLCCECPTAGKYRSVGGWHQCWWQGTSNYDWNPHQRGWTHTIRRGMLLGT